MPGLLTALGRVLTLVTIDDVLAEGEKMGRKLPSADDVKLTLNHWTRKRLLLTEQLEYARSEELKAQIAYDIACKREEKIAAARRLVPDEQ